MKMDHKFNLQQWKLFKKYNNDNWRIIIIKTITQYGLRIYMYLFLENSSDGIFWRGY